MCSQIYYADSFKCAMQLWIPSFLTDCIFLAVFIASTPLHTIGISVHGESCIEREMSP